MVKTGSVAAGLLLLFFLTSCDERKVVSVTHVGELENLVRDGDMSTHARLKDFQNQPDLYAIGVVTNGEGFITVIGGQPYISKVDTGKMVMIDSTFNADATLLLYSHVKKWKTYEIPSDVNTWKQLEQFISNEATKYNVSKTDAFPFMMKGTAESLTWHVLNLRQGIKEITYKKLLTLGQAGTLSNENIEAIGFYSRDSKEIFVHQETVLNTHFVNHDHSLSGRIEDMTINGGMTLYLPEDDK